MGPIWTFFFLQLLLHQTVLGGIIFPDADLDYEQQFRDKKSVESEPIQPCPGGQLFCEDEVEDYPQNVKIVDQIVSAQLLRNAIFDTKKKENSLQSENALRTAFVKEARACDNRKATVYPKKAQNIDGKYVFIVNDNNYRQAVDIEQCLGDGEPCHTESDNPTFDSETICRQKYATYRMYVINEEGEQVYDSFSLPSACLCHHKSNFAIRNAFKSVADTPPLPVCSGPEKLALNTQQQTMQKLGSASGSRQKPKDSGITFGSRRRRQFKFNDDTLKPEECEGSYCEEGNGKYPKELVLRALRNNNDLNPQLFSQLFDTQCQPSSLKTRFFNIDEEQLCYGVPKIIFPRQAKNLKDEWKYIVNIDNYTQSVEIEECFNADAPNDNSTEVGDDVLFGNSRPVEDNFGSCLYSGAPGNNPSLTSCRQLFTDHKLLSLSTDGQLVVDSFKLPSACACFYKEDFTLEFRRDMEDKTEEAPKLDLPEQVEQTIQFN